MTRVPLAEAQDYANHMLDGARALTFNAKDRVDRYTPTNMLSDGAMLIIEMVGELKKQEREIARLNSELAAVYG